MAVNSKCSLRLHLAVQQHRVSEAKVSLAAGGDRVLKGLPKTVWLMAAGQDVEKMAKLRIRPKGLRLLLSSVTVIAVLALTGHHAIEWLQGAFSDFAIVGMRFGGGGSKVAALAFAPDGKRLAAGFNFDAVTCIWDVETGSQLTLIEEEEEGEHLAIRGMTFSPDGKLIAVGVVQLTEVGQTGPEVRLRDSHTGRLIRKFEGVATRRELLAFSPDGRLFAAGSRILRMPEGVLVRRFPLPEKFWIRGVDFSPDGSLFAISGFINTAHAHPESLAFVYQVQTGRLVKSLKCPDNLAHNTCAEGKAIDFHRDGKRLAMGTIVDQFYVWDIETDEVQVVRREGGRWWAVTFSPNGELLAASGGQGTVLIWDMNTEKELCALKGHVLSVYGLEFSPKGDLLASGGMDGKVRLWGVKGRAWRRWGLVRVLQLRRSRD